MDKDATQELDLDIDNYNFNDILRLFKLPQDFDELGLKRAKQVVLKTHPDKSKLPSKYFIFYSKAYKVLLSIWEFKNKATKNAANENTDYSVDTVEEKKIVLDTFIEKNKNLKNPNDFNKWFNEQFEKTKIESDNDSGYGEWLKSNENVDEEKRISYAQMKDEFQKKKEQVRSLVVHKDYTDMYYSGSISSSELLGSGEGGFNSGLFSNLNYQDLRQAHVESVIPVSEEDYNRLPKFKTMEEYNAHRNKQDTKPLSELQAQEYLNQRKQLGDVEASSRAYQLAKQTEEAGKRSKEFWKSLLKIKEN
jgi:hypothetical protein